MSMSKSTRFLVVDDHPIQCMWARQLFEDAGVDHVDTTLDARQALTMLRNQAYDLVLVDLHMPEMDGVQFIDALTGLGRIPLLAIVSSCSRRLMNSVSLMAEEKGLSVLGTFPKPLELGHIREICEFIATHQTTAARVHTEHTSVFEQPELELAISRRELKARFQPRKCLSSGTIVGAEALVRWHNPQLGLLMPVAFLPSITRHGLDRDLLFLMLEDAIHAHKHWHAQGHQIIVSVNLPTALLDDPALPDQLHQMTCEAGLAASNICFELLENQRPVSPGHYYMGACRLRLKGFGLAQDDFGMGYSSMYSLISTPFTEMKIDRYFVNGAAADKSRSAALFAAVQLGRQLGLEVIAEGVESLQDLEFLRMIGCDSAQGYLISAALELDAFSQLLGCSDNPSFFPPTWPSLPLSCQTSRCNESRETP